MAKLIGKAVGNTLVEFLGPIEGRNYNVAGLATANPATLELQVFGSGSIQVQESQTFIFKGNDGNNVFTTEMEADPASWANLGAAIAATDGLVTRTLTDDLKFSAIRIIVAVAGTGRYVCQSIWV